MNRTSPAHQHLVKAAVQTKSDPEGSPLDYSRLRVGSVKRTSDFAEKLRGQRDRWHFIDALYQVKADLLADQLRHVLETYPALRAAVATKLAQKWSPQQIAGWLRQRYSDDPTMHVSHETIYLSLFVQSRGVLKKALQAQLRQRRTIRRPRAAAPKTGGYIVGAVSIRERPATVEDRAVPGHWEGDLLVGSRNSYIATLVERRSRYVCLVRVTGKDTQTVVRALTRRVQRLPAGLMATLPPIPDLLEEVV